jgi:hypothetical protein
MAKRKATVRGLKRELVSARAAVNNTVGEMAVRLRIKDELIRKLQDEATERHHRDITAVVGAWAQTTESFSKAVLALKGVL